MTALGHQLIVRADLHEPGPIKYDDEISHAHRRETVGDEDRNAAAVALAGAARRCGVALEQRVFRLRVQRGGPVIPRSKSRATVRSLVSVGSSRCPMPGGRTQASVSRS